LQRIEKILAHVKLLFTRVVLLGLAGSESTDAFDVRLRSTVLQGRGCGSFRVDLLGWKNRAAV
jgi:hypothetical protein